MKKESTHSVYSNSDALKEALKNGAHDAFVYIFNNHYDNLYSYALRILNDENDAGECVQSTFCHIWDIRERLEIRDSLRSYLYRSVYNNSISIIRKNKVLDKYEERGLADLYFSRVIQSPDAELRLTDSETRKEIIESINSLPVRCREIFIKCKVGGQSYIEVASSLEISVNTVENQMAIALKKLRERLKYLILF
ncbi:MAG: RNA polymerase sigma-70 factor [Bacteroidetes bacterium HGW-Bacteroidetes-8]|nr:MAG: RNA polymerase sigma-70 factor [Bacteroidetes bacterium HGW-Bacteroidetes-8]